MRNVAAFAVNAIACVATTEANRRHRMARATVANTANEQSFTVRAKFGRVFDVATLVAETGSGASVANKASAVVVARLIAETVASTKPTDARAAAAVAVRIGGGVGATELTGIGGGVGASGKSATKGDRGENDGEETFHWMFLRKI